jgi:hypothetical protein
VNPPEEDEWERKLRVVSESFDEDIPDPVTSAAEDNPGTLEAFAEFWKAGDEVFLELTDEGMVPVVRQEETTSHQEGVMQANEANRQRGKSLSFLELIDMDDDDFERKDIMEV